MKALIDALCDDESTREMARDQFFRIGSAFCVAMNAGKRERWANEFVELMV